MLISQVVFEMHYSRAMSNDEIHQDLHGLWDQYRY